MTVVNSLQAVLLIILCVGIVSPRTAFALAVFSAGFGSFMGLWKELGWLQ